MTVKSVVRGVTVGATVGTVCYMMSKATSKQKHDIRKNAGKAVKAAGCILDDLTSLIWLIQQYRFRLEITQLFDTA